MNGVGFGGPPSGEMGLFVDVDFGEMGFGVQRALGGLHFLEISVVAFPSLRSGPAGISGVDSGLDLL